MSTKTTVASEPSTGSTIEPSIDYTNHIKNMQFKVISELDAWARAKLFRSVLERFTANELKVFHLYYDNLLRKADLVYPSWRRGFTKPSKPPSTLHPSNR